MSTDFADMLLGTVKSIILFEDLTERVANIEDFCMSRSSLWTDFYPRITVTEGTGKKAKKVSKAVKPGKPWSLPSVCPFERAAIREVYGHPWEELDALLFEDDNGKRKPKAPPITTEGY